MATKWAFLEYGINLTAPNKQSSNVKSTPSLYDNKSNS